MPPIPKLMPGLATDATFAVALVINGWTVGSFQECSGIGMRIRTKQVREGGLNDGVIVLPDGVEFDNLTLKRGVTNLGSLMAWVTTCQTLGFRSATQEVSVVVHGPDGSKTAHWVFSDAWPVRWTGPTLNAGGSGVATESLEIAYRRMTSIPCPPPPPPLPPRVPPAPKGPKSPPSPPPKASVTDKLFALQETFE